MPTVDLRAIKTFPQLVKYLRDELNWPIESSDFEELTFEYSPEELGLDSGSAAKIKEIKQLRPLESKQPWGIFFVDFEPKRLPVVALRRILRSLVLKKRQTANKSQQAAWQMHDLLFISTYGESKSRDITFAHFAEEPGQGDLPILRVLGWDDEDTALHTSHTDKMLREKLCWPKDTKDIGKWRETWSSAFTLRHQQVVKTSKELALRLADLALKIRKRARAVLALENDKGQLRKLHAAFKEALIHDLTEDDFADMYAQTISYGLLTARISRPSDLIAENLTDMVPVTNPFLKELLETFLNVGGRKGKIDFDELGISEVVQLLRDADMPAVLRDFGDRNPDEDPAIHFYELFLKEYDPKKRMQRGVFYTPRPVVSFIVRSVHLLLQKEFGLADGLADISTWGEMASRIKDLKIPDGVSADEPFVKILDPATGTGTFLVEAIEVIHQAMEAKWLKAGHMALEIPNLWNEYVPKHLLPRVYGYELMMAPYAIAHMKIGLKLYETAYRFRSNERARIYLTNALEPPKDFSDRLAFDAPELAHEAQAVNAIKRSIRFTVVVGNPPYSNFGQLNRNSFILDLLEDYKQGLGEKKLNLDDDFIKFVRYSQYILDTAGIGLFGMITNSTYLDGVTHRQMRASLLQSFGYLFVLDLHGSSKRQQANPFGGDDANVFDIQTGVAISIFVARSTPACLKHSEVWGERSEKYAQLDSLSQGEVHSSKLNPESPYWFFIPKRMHLSDEYERWPDLKDVFGIAGSGIKTERDRVSIHWTLKACEETVEDFRTQSDQFLRQKYDLEKDSRDWTVLKAKADVTINKSDALFRRILYRPFDLRHTWYSGQTRGFIGTPGFPTMRHMLHQKNIALLSCRQQAELGFHHAFCTDQLAECCAVSLKTREITSVFPLFVFNEGHNLGFQNKREPNFTPSFLRSLCSSLRVATQEGLPEGLSPESIFGYLYAILYSPTYRTRYAEFLKIGFPRLPITANLELFRSLGNLGSALVSLHLLKSPKLINQEATYKGPTKPVVEKVSHFAETVWLDKTQTYGFQGVTDAVWNFHIGGYQVCEKWLKDRKGRTLSKEDIDHYQRIIVALSETIRIVAEIDKVIDAHGGWPGAFVNSPAQAAKASS